MLQDKWRLRFQKLVADIADGSTRKLQLHPDYKQIETGFIRS